jgi:hypothetical protein
MNDRVLCEERGEPFRRAFMKWLGDLVASLIALLRVLIVDGSRSLQVSHRILLDLLERCRARRGWTEHEKNRDPAPCTPIRRPEFKRPDPLIYAQFYFMSLGFAVTWDNPDITLEIPKAGPVDPAAPPDPANTVSSGDLKPDTEYDIVARIWNGSTAAPVVGLPVHFSYLSFGIGVTSNPIGSGATDLGVKGGPGCPAYARMRWRTPATAGHYCIQVLLDWFDDLNPANNLGQENSLVGVAHSPASFTFRLGNQERTRQTFRFEVDNFAIPEPISCSLVDRQAEAERRRRAEQAQKQPPVAGRPETFAAPLVPPDRARGNLPLPQGWTVDFDPATPTLAPGEERDIRVSIEPPAGFSGRMPVNVHAFSERGLAGGVTLYVERP